MFFLMAENFSAIRVHRTVVFRSTLSRCKVRDTDEKSRFKKMLSFSFYLCSSLRGIWC